MLLYSGESLANVLDAAASILIPVTMAVTILVIALVGARGPLMEGSAVSITVIFAELNGVTVSAHSFAMTHVDAPSALNAGLADLVDLPDLRV